MAAGRELHSTLRLFRPTLSCVSYPAIKLVATTRLARAYSWIQTRRLDYFILIALLKLVPAPGTAPGSSAYRADTLLLSYAGVALRAVGKPKCQKLKVRPMTCDLLTFSPATMKIGPGGFAPTSLAASVLRTGPALSLRRTPEIGYGDGN